MKLSIFVGGILSVGLTTAIPSFRRNLADCLGDKKVPVTWPSAKEYAELAEPFNLRLAYKPAAIVLPITAQHVQDAVVCATHCNYKVQARSGGHSYASYSSGGKDGSLVIDLQPMQDITLDKNTGIAKVGGGVRLGNLAQGIWDQGQRGLPHGTCTGVGIGGHFTHGGYGHTSRKWGIALDTITAVDVVLADGTLAHASPTEYPDVFWAVRGAADSIGVVVNFYLQTNPAPKDITYFSFKWGKKLYGDRDTFVKTFSWIQEVARNATIIDDRISFGINMNGVDSYNLGGTFFGTVDEFKAHIPADYLRSRGVPEPESIIIQSYDWIGYLTLMSDKDTIKEPLTGYDNHDNFFAKSITVPEEKGLSDASLGAWFDFMMKGAPTPYFVITNLYGGPGSKINTKDTNFAAYNDRDSLWVLQLYGNKENAGDEAVPFINGLTKSITDAAPETKFGAYLNYVDPSLSAQEAHSLYYGEELYQRLLKVKKEVDPLSVFWNPQAIGA